MIKAKALKKGDVISIIAPASASRSEERITKAVAYLEGQGYRVVVGKHLMDGHGYLAATDKDRLRDLHAAFSNKQVKAIFFIRGGYGTIRLLPDVDYDLIKRNPKILVGYSDATSLINAIYRKTGLLSQFYGPMPGVDMWNGFEPFAEENFWRAMTTSKGLGELPMSDDEGVVLNKGKEPAVVGRLNGGNLTVYASILGTGFNAQFKNSMFFFEDIDEKPYRCDRYFAQLKAMGAFEQATGILLGQFAGCVDEDSTSFTIDEVFKDYFGRLKVPVIANLPSGHVQRQWTIPFGAKYYVEIKRGKASISVAESVLTE